MTSGLHDIDGQVVAVWKYRFDIGPDAWECPAFKATADLIRSRNGAAYENTEQLVPLSRISAQGEYVPLAAAHAEVAPAMQAEFEADQRKRKS